ncbi:hypothetical protein IWQ48_004370 [Labrenzia sp. EL_13]|nr:hypothetical protein [Labrenzia sp. EL_195]MBG6203213.1 hypothetical protein [Labrenzia sp. EL_13]
MLNNLESANDFNEFLNDAHLCSIRARFGLAMCLLNEFANRHQIAGKAFNEFRKELWESPLLWASIGDAVPWYENLKAFDEREISSENAFGANDPISTSSNDIIRFVNAAKNTESVLLISFYFAADNEGTLELLKNVAEICRPPELPPTTPFKFSTFSQGSGWGPKLHLKDLRFWRKFSETWYLDLQDYQS